MITASRKETMPFSTYIAEKLANFDKRTRIIAKKRINDIIFELEMGEIGRAHV